jgi:hypothetical protein
LNILPNFKVENGVIKTTNSLPVLKDAEGNPIEGEEDPPFDFDKTSKLRTPVSKPSKVSKDCTPKFGIKTIFKSEVLKCEVLKNMVIGCSEDLNSKLKSVGQLMVINILKPEKFASYKKFIEPEIILPNIAVTTCTIIRLNTVQDDLLGISCLHGTHVGSSSLFRHIYGEERSGKRSKKMLKPRFKIKSNDYERVLLFVKNDNDIL